MGDQLVVMAELKGYAYGSLIQLGAGSAVPNVAPVVNAGADSTITLPGNANLSGTVSDDGQPTGTLLATWSVVSAPGAVAFANAHSATTSATFSKAGSYVLQLTADDGSLQSSDFVTIVVNASVQPNQAPIVGAGDDQTITLPGIANLNGSVSDDGQPSGTLASVWTQISGPGTVTFGNASAPATTAAFSQAGTYVLQLMASDGSLQASDQLTIVVADEPVANPHSGTSDPGLVGSWSLDGNGSDQSGLGNNGTTAGTTSYVTGKNDQALGVSGSGRLVVPDNSSLDITDAITLSAWIQPSAKGTQYFMTKKGKSGTDGFELSLSNSGTIFVRFNETSSGNSYRVDSTTKYATNGQTWIHVAATYDGTTIKLYINGQLEGSKNANFKIATNTLPLSIGSGENGYRGMQGAIDDARIYSRALSASEVTALLTNAPPVTPQNTAPSVNAGADQSITLPGIASLSGSASDDGQPFGTLGTTWSKVSGPGAVSFGNTGATSTTATFSQAGTYVLRLTANDGSLQTSDDVTIQVNTAVAQNTAPNVNAGADQSITLPGIANLSGSANDDGQPFGTLTTTWTKISGPGSVAFGNVGTTSTTATFSQAGAYVLRLTANDGSLQTSDDLTIVVAAAPSSGNIDGLVGSWSLDGNGNDASGLGNNGTPAGSASYVAGQTNQVLGVSGNGRLEVPDDASLDMTNAITISAWIKPSGAARNM